MSKVRIHQRASCLEAASRLLDVHLLLQGNFSSTIDIEMPRWVPGSYLIREPLRHVRDITVSGGAKIVRNGTHGYRIKPPKGGMKDILVNYKLLCPDLTVRSNHMDASHLHLVPTFTWMMPKRGWDGGDDCTVTLMMPEGWSAASQLNDHPASPPKHKVWTVGNERTWQPPDVDELYDGVIEANAEATHSRMMSGAMHHLRVWDAGGYVVPEQAIERIQDAMEILVNEFVALFGPLPFTEYWTILHLTGGPRGGLEHLRSQTSMVPRIAIQSGQDDAWRDLVSLLSHEYLHLWNVKRLRPREFIDYDLSKEVHSELLWWFEGGTSWLGDIICVKSGVWSEKDWRKDLERKMKRFNNGRGNEHQSLATSSHEAWIHLYRPHTYSRESTISYYLEGEMVMMCLDAELRRRSKGQTGLENLFALLWKRHGLDSPELETLGVRHSDIRKGLTSLHGGARMGTMLDRLTKENVRPDLNKAMSSLGLEFISPEDDDKKPQGWLGMNLSTKKGGLYVQGFLPDSPLRDSLLPDDELISLDGLRVRNKSELNSVLLGRQDTDASLTINRQGVMMETSFKIACEPELANKLEGKGNRLWQSMLQSNQSS
ncbi:MAG: hypothetical protein QF707_04870 [Candidatus Poseidoniaceae archaeon]|nr:hypothetical protein [Candidatus Poseidoniaceae archaeon]MDP7202694.1 hypothetical protein [Candidatus Poseidoniaceae archaeon]